MVLWKRFPGTQKEKIDFSPGNFMIQIGANSGTVNGEIIFLKFQYWGARVTDLVVCIKNMIFISIIDLSDLFAIIY